MKTMPEDEVAEVVVHELPGVNENKIVVRTGDLTRERAVFQDIRMERLAQLARWGDQHHPDGTGSDGKAAADQARQACQERAAAGTVTWRDILAEEVAEAFAETGREPLRRELIQVAAVAAAWVRDLDGREGDQC